jgi:hypothetical protein
MKSKTKQPTLDQIVRATVILFVMQFGALSASQAQESAAESVQDEVAAVEEKPIRQLRRELDTAEKDFFSIFNKINSDNSFDTKCKRITQLGSRKKEQVCTPKFIRLHVASLASSSSFVNDQWDLPSPAGSRMEMKKTQMREEINRLLTDNESFMQVFQSYASAKRAYETGMQNQ